MHVMKGIVDNRTAWRRNGKNTQEIIRSERGKIKILLHEVWFQMWNDEGCTRNNLS